MAAGIAWSTVGLIAEIAFAPTDITVQAHPAAADCPAASQVQQALERQLGPDREVLAGWTLRYGPAARNSSSPEQLAVEVRDGKGALRAERHLVARNSDCAATADIVAAIVARAARPLSWSALPAPRPRSPQAEVRVSAPPPSKPGRWPGVSLGAGPAFVTGVAASPNIAVELGVHGLGPLAARAGILILPLHAAESVGRAGTAELTRTALYCAVTWPWRKGPLLLEAGPAVSVALDRAQTRGISNPDQGRRTALSSGVLVGAALGLGTFWRVGLWATALGRVAASNFSVAVDASDAVVLRQPAVQGITGLRVEWTPFP